MNTTLVQERPSWHAEVYISKYRAADERDAMHLLYPEQAAFLDKAEREGFKDRILRLSPFVIPHISGEDYRSLNFDPYQLAEYEHNLLVNAGINRMEALLIAAGGQAYDNTHTAIGVGDGAGSVPTAAATDTDLAAIVNAANRYFQMADATYPSQATQVVTVQSTVATGNGNFQWREWGIDQHTASGATASTAPLLNHKGVDLGLKTSAASWVFRVTITIS